MSASIRSQSVIQSFQVCLLLKVSEFSIWVTQHRCQVLILWVMQSLTNYCSTRLFDVNFTSSFISSQVNETKLWPAYGLEKKNQFTVFTGIAQRMYGFSRRYYICVGWLRRMMNNYRLRILITFSWLMKSAIFIFGRKPKHLRGIAVSNISSFGIGEASVPLCQELLIFLFENLQNKRLFVTKDVCQ